MSKDVSYKSFIKKKCDCCQATGNLTVHHVVGQEFHKYIPAYKVVPKDLKTLCEECHRIVESEIQRFKDQLPVTAYYQSIIRFQSQVSTAVDLLKNGSLTKQQHKFIAGVRDSVVLYDQRATIKTVNIVVPTKWTCLHGIDEDQLCRMLRDLYKVFKQKRKLLCGLHKRS